MKKELAILALGMVVPLCSCRHINTNGKLVLSHEGKTDYSIVYNMKVEDAVVNPAVKDLAHFLGEITGAEFPVVEKSEGPKIYIGVTAPGDTRAFQSRERRIRSVGRDIYIYGDYRYGTAGAIYRFLDTFCGCRWFTATGDMKVPRNPDLSFNALDFSHVPSFKSIEHGGRWSTAVVNPDIRAWVRRNNSFLMPNYSFGEPDDAWNYIGPVTHTLFAYMPPIIRKPRSFNDDGAFCAGPHLSLAGKEFFSTHPEYFTMNSQGKRVPNKQLCFSNPEVRAKLLEHVTNAITYEKYNSDEYAVMDFSQNDYGGGFCHCPGCTELAKKYGTPGGPYFDFLKEMGEHFKPIYPKLTFRFFAYQEDMTGIPPKGLQFPDNMSVIIAPLAQDFSKPFTDKYNVRFLNQMRVWGKLCKEVWLWNYPTLYPHGIHIYSLFPGIYRNTENMKLAYDAGVRYIIGEQGGSVVHGCSFKELNVYLQSRMAEDVNVDVNAEIKEFCDACYGAASDEMQAYLKDADSECRKDPGYFHYYFDPRVMHELHSGRNLVRWQKAFNKMESLVSGDKRALFNVRRARINLDAITLLNYPYFAAYDKTFAEKETLQAVYDRYCKYVTEDADEQYKNVNDKAAKQWHINSFILEGARMPYEFYKRHHTYPKELIEKYGEENLMSAMPCQIRSQPAYWGDETESGYAVKVGYTEEKIGIQQVYVGTKDDLPWNTSHYIPFPNPLFSSKNKELFKSKPGYNCYYAGTGKLTTAGKLSLKTIPSRRAEFFIGEFYDAAKPNQEYDFYISLKDNGDGKTMMVDRVVLARKVATK